MAQLVILAKSVAVVLLLAAAVVLVIAGVMMVRYRRNMGHW